MGVDIQKILTKLRITALNEMQQHAAEAILGSDGDVVLLSPTGTGKTLAYQLPLIQLLDATSDQVQALVITPGRELALQSDSVLKNMGCGLRSTACYGGRPTMDEHRVLKEVRPQIVFGTPGRLNDHLDKDNISRYHIRYLVIDEFDKCLEMGFHQEMQKLLKSLPGLQRRILLSATNAEQIPQFVNMSKKGTLIDFLPEEEQTSERVTLYEVRSPQKDKLETLRQLLLSLGNQSSIVFLNYRDSVERTNEFLRHAGFTTSYFHGGMEQRQREDMLYKFSNGTSHVLVSTDLGSRGLDIPDTDCIIHYHLPLNEEAYTHRNGRTARWEAEGRAFMILNEEETLPEYIDEHTVQKFYIPKKLPPIAQPKMATIYIGKGKKDKLSKMDVLGFLCKIGGLERNDVGRIDVRDHCSYAAVSRTVIKDVLKRVEGQKIKGIKTIFREAR